MLLPVSVVRRILFCAVEHLRSTRTSSAYSRDGQHPQHVHCATRTQSDANHIMVAEQSSVPQDRPRRDWRSLALAPDSATRVTAAHAQRAQGPVERRKAHPVFISTQRLEWLKTVQAKRRAVAPPAPKPAQWQRGGGANETSGTSETRGTTSETSGVSRRRRRVAPTSSPTLQSTHQPRDDTTAFDYCTTA